MPFIDKTGAPLDGVHLLYRPTEGDLRLFQLEHGFAWIDPRDGSRTEIRAHDVTRPATDPHNATDLASVPAFLWGLVASYGHQTLPAILHDALSDRADEAPAPRQIAVRRAADDAFRVALRESGVTTLRATTMWAAVSIQRYLRFRLPLGVLLVAQVALGALAVITAVVLGVLGHPLLLLIGLAPAALALPWGRTAPLVIASSYLVALYSPLIISAALSSAIEYLIALVVFLLSGLRGAPPHPGPTLRKD
ncbi:MAG: DUF1353 domain-containing protein [Pseudolysinimonas sp.]